MEIIQEILSNNGINVNIYDLYNSVMITQEKIDELDKISKDYDVKLYLPPFHNSLNLFFDINNIKEDIISFKDFLMEVKSKNIYHKFVDIDGHKYLELIDE